MIATKSKRPSTRRGNPQMAAFPAPIIAVFDFPSRLGWMALAADEDTVHGLTFGHEVAPKAVRSLRRIIRDAPNDTCRVSDASAEIRSLIQRLQEFADGRESEFLDVRLNLSHLTPFGEIVTQRCRKIPWGDTLSYRDLAVACGHPGAARAVGNVMRNNRFPLIVPCHRVLATGGGLGGYSAPQGLQMKERLLVIERST